MPLNFVGKTIPVRANREDESAIEMIKISYLKWAFYQPYVLTHVFLAYTKKFARPNWDANAWEKGMTVDANSLRYLPRWLSKNYSMYTANSDRQIDSFKENWIC